MQVKTFLGKSAAQALAQVKAELGPDAVILNSRDVSKGSVRLHEIVAGIERIPTPAAAEAGPIAYSLPGKPDNSNGGNGRAAHFGDNFESAISAAGELGLLEAANLPLGWRQWHKDWNSLREHILALLKPEMRLENLAPRQRLALEYLQREGVDDEVIIKLYRSLLADSGQSVLEPLAELVTVKPWGFKHWRNKVHLVAGPFGAGKTVTALRMAISLRDENSDARVAIINADCDRGHGRLILKHYCELLDIDYFEAASAAEMRAALEDAKGADRILVDLPGLAADETLSGLLKRFGLTGKTALHMVLAPHFSKEHIRGLLTAYEAERCASLIWTKLDEAYSFGALANASVMCGLPISALSFGPGLTDSLCPVRENQLWHLLFKHELPSAKAQK